MRAAPAAGPPLRGPVLSRAFREIATARAQVMELLIFIFFVFGIIGIQLFSGLLRQRCYSTVPPYEMFPPHPEARTRLRDERLGALG